MAGDSNVTAVVLEKDTLCGSNNHKKMLFVLKRDILIINVTEPQLFLVYLISEQTHENNFKGSKDEYDLKYENVIYFLKNWLRTEAIDKK